MTEQGAARISGPATAGISTAARTFPAEAPGSPGYTAASNQQSSYAMSKVEDLEEQIRQMSAEELADFRRWFAEFDAEVWDRQLERDIQAGKLDAMD